MSVPVIPKGTSSVTPLEVTARRARSVRTVGDGRHSSVPCGVTTIGRLTRMGNSSIFQTKHHQGRPDLTIQEQRLTPIVAAETAIANSKLFDEAVNAWVIDFSYPN